MMSKTLLLLNTIADTTGTDNDLHENKAVGAVILIVVFALAIWLAWPSLKANNVFSKKSINKYGTSEEVVKKNQKVAVNLLVTIFALAYLGLGCLLYPLLSGKDEQGLNPIGVFSFSFAGMVAAYIYTYIDPGSFRSVCNLRYTLKIWLTTMVVSPLVLILMDIHRINTFKSFYDIYTNTVKLGHGIGIVTLTVILFAVDHISKQQRKLNKKRSYILLIAEAALLINMFILALCMHSGARWLLEVLPYTVIMALCIWFYPMDNTVYSDIVDAEVIE